MKKKCKKTTQKKKKKTTPQHFCVAEDCVLLEGGVMYGFTGSNFTTVPGSTELNKVQIRFKNL